MSIETGKLRKAAYIDVEAMLAACVPGGSIADPQAIADAIRAWAAEQPAAQSLSADDVSRRFRAFCDDRANRFDCRSGDVDEAGAFRAALESFAKSIEQPAAQGDAVACHRLLYLNHSGEWTNFGLPGWLDGGPDQQLLKEMVEPNPRWRIEYAYPRPAEPAAMNELLAALDSFLADPGARFSEPCGARLCKAKYFKRIKQARKAMLAAREGQ